MSTKLISVRFDDVLVQQADDYLNLNPSLNWLYAG